MELLDFRIGAEFTARGARWRCTDTGTRTVAAIRVDEAEISTKREGEVASSRTVSGVEAETMGLFGGPPYGVVEHLFDEDDIKGCEPIEKIHPMVGDYIPVHRRGG